MISAQKQLNNLIFSNITFFIVQNIFQQHFTIELCSEVYSTVYLRVVS